MIDRSERTHDERMGERHTLVLNREGVDPSDQETVRIEYERRPTGWYVRTPVDGDFWLFADANLLERDVKQLLNKKWCGFYTADPDPLTDRG